MKFSVSVVAKSLALILLFSYTTLDGQVDSQETLPQQLANPNTVDSSIQRPGPDDDEENEKPAPPRITGPAARGIVFIDNDENGIYSEGDSAAAGIKVSNGVDIVKTDKFGAYEIGLQDDQILFVIKPNGLRTAIGPDKLPKFFYIHKPNGSPKLKFPGSAKTGDIPRSVDFPLYEQEEPENFQLVMFADPQPRNQTEINYITQDVISELVGTGASFGVTLGDIMFDDLSLFESLNNSIALIGIPWYNVLGNHDINLDAPSRKLVNETFERVYGPTYYSFNYGQVHFVVLDNIDWVPAARGNRASYKGKLGGDQLVWLKKDLALVPESQMVVIFMHIPIKGVEDRQELFRLIENRPSCISVSAHTHYHEHQFLNEKDGWKGKKPHHHLINVTVSGSWWSGVKDERGIPHSTMADGAPNGYSTLSFEDEGKNYRLDFKGAGLSPDKQMGIRLANEIDSVDTGKTDVWVNVYNGSEKSKVEMQLGGMTSWIEMERKVAVDPYFQRLFDAEQKMDPPPKPRLTKPIESTHLWTAKLPADLKPGYYNLNVKTVDMHDRVFYDKRLFRVTGK